MLEPKVQAGESNQVSYPCRHAVIMLLTALFFFSCVVSSRFSLLASLLSPSSILYYPEVDLIEANTNMDDTRYTLAFCCKLFLLAFAQTACLHLLRVIIIVNRV